MIIFNIKYKMKDQFIYYISTDTNKECIYDKFNYITYHPNIELGGWGNDGRIFTEEFINDLIEKYNKRIKKN